MNNKTAAIINNIFAELLALQESLSNETDNVISKGKETVIEKLEMLTIKECAELIRGLSEHTVRQLVKQGKIKSIRTGEGKSGKILGNKADFVAYFSREVI